MADFFIRELMQPNAHPEPRAVDINGVVWHAQPILKKALFPLRAGDLEIGPLQRHVRRGPAQRRERRVAREPDDQSARERAALAGRPVGYQIGDVGSYYAFGHRRAAHRPKSAARSPSRISLERRRQRAHGRACAGVLGHRVARAAAARGHRGRERQGSRARGRSPTSCARRRRELSISATSTLPYWNPERKTYEVARASLGKMLSRARKNIAPRKDPEPAARPLELRSRQSASPGRLSARRDPLTENPFFWGGLFGAPSRRRRQFARVARFASLALVIRGAKKERTNEASTRPSPRLATRESATTRQALAAALERAVYLAIERVTALKARALMHRPVPAALAERGVAVDLAAEIKRELATIEAARFVPDLPGDGAGAAALSLRDLFDKAEAVAHKVGRMPPVAKE